ncbi:hypothetical protein NQ317_013209 [Molorchus minor]|uniref:Trehalase n=1 Tax=Molorchus minor TaxID=1323400 RepID=A0ABQ9J5C7_9CUCU|nr:hypothetical protein NQ317_013209 [Molorchus minor]
MPFQKPNFHTIFLLLVGLLSLIHVCSGQTKQSCYSPIYCQGDLLHIIQTSKIFNDSKTFVDMALVGTVNETLAEFNQLMMENDNKPSREQLQEFVGKNFVSIGELEDVFPKRLEGRAQNREGNQRTPRARLYKVLDSALAYTDEKIEHPFVIPGGRFREYYYWDCYWIIKGLLLSEMYETARGMIQNLLSMVERFGFIPNGGRIYYLNRSQPPLLTFMVADYMKWSNDFEFVRYNIKTIEKELQFWLKHRTVTLMKEGREYVLCHYDSFSDTPRPESYLEDIETCATRKTDDEKVFIHCNSWVRMLHGPEGGAESGWDFTVRWFYDNQGKPAMDIQHIHTRRTIPADLNAYLYKAFKEVSKFYTILMQEEDAKYWQDLADKWKENMREIHYNEEDGVWYDYDAKLGKHRKFFFASNLVPLWAEVYEESERLDRGKSAADYLTKNGIIYLKGGIPTSTIPSGQQWDYPNAWAPFQNLIILGLQKTGHPEALALAKNFAHTWVNSNIKAFQENKVMFEKYDAKNSGQFGGGGEYIIQAGFGWTNGCVMELIDAYFRTHTRKWISS